MEFLILHGSHASLLLFTVGSLRAEAICSFIFISLVPGTSLETSKFLMNCVWSDLWPMRGGGDWEWERGSLLQRAGHRRSRGRGPPRPKTACKRKSPFNVFNE